MKKVLIFLLLIFGVEQICAQSFMAEAPIPEVQDDGFYRILLPPVINRHVNDDFSDIRIYDSKNVEVSYLLEHEIPATLSTQFYEYEIVDKQLKKGCCTSLVLRNPDKSPINNINLVIKNAQASRYAALLGSDDQKQWFALKDFIVLRGSDSEETSESKIVEFPWSNYEYYLLRVDDSTFAPLNILRAGYYKQESADGRYTRLEPLKLAVTDKIPEKKSYVSFSLAGPQFLDKLEILVSGSKYYRRRATLSEKRVSRSKDGKKKEYFRDVQNFELTSGRTAILSMDNIRGQEFLITIENDDNAPLVISEIKAYQLNRYLTAWLNHHQPYKLKFGDRNLHQPIYDIAFFKDSIPKQIPILEAGAPKIFETPEAASSTSFFTNKNLVWIAIVAVIVLLGFMSIKMVKQTSQKESKD